MLSLRGPASHDVILETGFLTEGGDWLGVALVRLLPPRSWFLPRLQAALAASARRVAAAIGRARSRFAQKGSDDLARSCNRTGGTPECDFASRAD